MFFLVWGTKYIDKEVKDGIVVNKRCPKCRDYRPLYEFRKEKWFSLFYIPLFSHGYEGSSFLKCLYCDTDYYLNPGDIDVNDKSRLLDFDDRIVITCPRCETKQKVKPFVKEEIQIRCGRCKQIFSIRKNFL